MLKIGGITMFICNIIAILIVVLIAYELQNHSILNLLKGGKPNVDLAVCILSARDHFAKRQVLRETWLKDLPINKLKHRRDVKPIFVIGKKGCPYHPDNRVDPYDCIIWNASKTVIGESLDAFRISPNKIHRKNILDRLVQRLSIKVLHQVTIQRIGIAKYFFSTSIGKQPIVLSLFDGSTEEEIVTARFSELDPGVLHNGYYYQPIHPQILPKGLECELSMDDIERDSLDISNTEYVTAEVYMNDGGALLIEGMNTDRTYIKDQNFSSLISFMFTVEGTGESRAENSRRQEMDTEWQNEQQNTDEKLLKEEKEYGDVLLVDMMDVYRSLPKKLMACHSWIKENVNVKYVMKSDDDCLVDMDRILQNLPAYSNVKLWWGNFRNDWFVERHGKWKEKYYAAASYPKFACGSGNIIAAEVHDWLVKNQLDLFDNYQGEDTSMGIWLAALGVQYYQDRAWMCNKTCDKNFKPYVVPELTVEEIRTMWSAMKLCDNACGCES